jgi:hypothetical protein
MVWVRGLLSVPAGELHRIIDCFQELGLHQLLLAQDPDAGTVAIQKIAMLYQLRQFDLCHVHERVDLVLGALEVLDTEGVDGDDLDAGLVAYF